MRDFWNSSWNAYWETGHLKDSSSPTDSSILKLLELDYEKIKMLYWIEVYDLVKLIDRQFHLVKKVRWTDQQISEKFAQRSAHQILEEGHTFYMNPCLDFTMSMVEQLRSSDKIQNLHFLFELARDYNPEYAGKEVPHFALQFEIDSQIYSIDFFSGNNVALRKWPYEYAKQNVERVFLLPINATLFSGSDDFTAIAEKVWMHFDKSFLIPQIKKLQSDNSVENFENFKHVNQHFSCQIKGFDEDNYFDFS